MSRCVMRKLCQICPPLLFVCSFSYAVSKTAKPTTLYNYTTNNGSERIQNKSCMGSYYIAPLNLSGPTEENSKKKKLNKDS
jgi:hypothetical protein